MGGGHRVAGLLYGSVSFISFFPFVLSLSFISFSLVPFLCPFVPVSFLPAPHFSFLSLSSFLFVLYPFPFSLPFIIVSLIQVHPKWLHYLGGEAPIFQADGDEGWKGKGGEGE